jgi:hypothetical protein
MLAVGTSAPMLVGAILLQRDIDSEVQSEEAEHLYLAISPDSRTVVEAGVETDIIARSPERSPLILSEHSSVSYSLTRRVLRYRSHPSAENSMHS